jgi:hypothetical protein
MLEKNPPRLVILADSDALDDRILDKLRNFAAAGGKILAEGNLASFDSSCRRRQAPAEIDGIFRVKEIRGGYAAAFGKEAGIRSKEEKAVLNAEREAFGEVLKKCGILPAVLYRTAAGELFLDGESVVMTDAQGNRYVLSVCRQKVGTPVTPEFADRKASVCNVRRNDCVMKDDSPLFFALLKEKETKALEVAASVNDEGAVAFRLSCAARDTVVRMTVKDPEGREVEHYAANIRMRAGKGEFLHLPALNDRKGSWCAEFREIVGGTAASCEFEVK